MTSDVGALREQRGVGVRRAAAACRATTTSYCCLACCRKRCICPELKSAAGSKNVLLLASRASEPPLARSRCDSGMIRAASSSVIVAGQHLDEAGEALAGPARDGRARASIRCEQRRSSAGRAGVGDAEVLVQRRVVQVGRDGEHVLACHAQRVREVRRDGALALARDRRGDDDDRAVGAVQPEQREVGSDRPVGVGQEARAREVGEQLRRAVRAAS